MLLQFWLLNGKRDYFFFFFSVNLIGERNNSKSRKCVITQKKQPSGFKLPSFKYLTAERFSDTQKETRWNDSVLPIRYSALILTYRVESQKTKHANSYFSPIWVEREKSLYVWAAKIIDSPGGITISGSIFSQGNYIQFH